MDLSVYFFSHVALDNFCPFWLLIKGRGGGWTPRLLLLEPRGFDVHRLLPCVARQGETFIPLAPQLLSRSPLGRPHNSLSLLSLPHYLFVLCHTGGFITLLLS